MKKETIERNAANEVAAWEQFLRNEGGCYPPKLAAAALKMSVQGVHAASERGWIRYFKVGRERYYSKRDVYNYRWTGSRKFKDNAAKPQFLGRQEQGINKTAKQLRLEAIYERAAQRLYGQGGIPSPSASA